MKTAQLFIILLITLIFLIVALWGIDFSTVFQTILETDWIWFFIVQLCYVMIHTVRSVRLWLLVEKKASFLSIFSINTIGFLAINTIPLRLGEFVRPYLLMTKEDIPFAQGMAAIILGRWLDLCMLLLLLLGLGFLVEIPEQGLVFSGVDIISAGQHFVSTSVLLGSVLGMGLVILPEHFLFFLKKIPLGEKVFSFVVSFRGGMRTLFANPLLAIQLFSLSLVIWSLIVGSVYFALRAFPDIPESLPMAWSTWTITSIAMIVAPTPGFIGVYELFCSTALLLWEIPKVLGTSFALALHGSQLFFTLFIGAIFLLWEGISLRSLISQSQEYKFTDPP